VILLIGTVPCPTGVYTGSARVGEGQLRVGGKDFPVERGTAAMAAACAEVCRFYGLEMPVCILGADVGDAEGTTLMFGEVSSSLNRLAPDVIVIHYLFPKIALGAPFIESVISLPKKPQLIADAGGMYLIKALKKSSLFDVFTPDEGEMVFLADEFAPHPLYIRRELAEQRQGVDILVQSAYKHRNAAKTLVVKGATDFVYTEGVKVRECREPLVPAMEAIGGTGDTITGMLAALRFGKRVDAEYRALVLNRLIGKRLGCTPATQISEFIAAIPAALEDYEKNPV
jgi:NAD(P)H-hydrate repair Nnr-like enzyme with NAD(P)H-hydrate dehydratase domain